MKNHSSIGQRRRSYCRKEQAGFNRRDEKFGARVVILSNPLESCRQCNRCTGECNRIINLFGRGIPKRGLLSRQNSLALLANHATPPYPALPACFLHGICQLHQTRCPSRLLDSASDDRGAIANFQSFVGCCDSSCRMMLRGRARACKRCAPYRILTSDEESKRFGLVSRVSRTSRQPIARVRRSDRRRRRR